MARITTRFPGNNLTQKMALDIDIKDDTLYQLGEEKGQEKAALNMLK